jgi:trehalose-6-phosphatase
VPLSRTQIFVSFILIVPLFSCFVIVDQLSLKMEPTMEDFDKYLNTYVGESKKLTLLLDYDGTLAPIAAHPNLTAMTEETKKSLDRIAECPNIFTAAISGRGVDDVKMKIGIEGIVYAGNHGLEILYPNGTRYNHQVPGEISDNYVKMVAALENVN